MQACAVGRCDSKVYLGACLIRSRPKSARPGANHAFRVDELAPDSDVTVQKLVIDPLTHESKAAWLGALACAAASAARTISPKRAVILASEERKESPSAKKAFCVYLVQVYVSIPRAVVLLALHS